VSNSWRFAQDKGMDMLDNRKESWDYSISDIANEAGIGRATFL